MLHRHCGSFRKTPDHHEKFTTLATVSALYIGVGTMPLRLDRGCATYISVSSELLHVRYYLILCTGGNNLNRVRRNLAGALLWFLWLRQGPAKLMSSELRKYDWIKKPDSLRNRLSISWSNTLWTLGIHIYSYANEVNRNGSRGRAEKKGGQYHHQYDLEGPSDQALDLISTHNLDKPGEQN